MNSPASSSAIRQVVRPATARPRSRSGLLRPYASPINSDDLDGLPTAEAKAKGHGATGSARSGPRHGQLPVARLGVLPATLLGRGPSPSFTVPRTARCRCPNRRCLSPCPRSSASQPPARGRNLVPWAGEDPGSSGLDPRLRSRPKRPTFARAGCWSDCASTSGG